MNYCLRCNKPCSNLSSSGSEPSVFCNECRSLLHNRLQPGNEVEAPKDFDLLHTSLWQEEGGSQTSLQAAPSAHTQLSQLSILQNQNPDADVQPENLYLPRSQVSLTSESRRHASAPQPAASPELEEDDGESHVWTKQADPLMARLATYKFPSVPVEQESMESPGPGQRQEDQGGGKRTPLRSPEEVVSRGVSLPPPWGARSVPRYIRVALVVLAILVVLALVVNGAIAFINVTRQHNAQRPASSRVLTATASTAQPSPTAQSVPSPSATLSPGAVRPTTTASSTHATPAAGTPAPAPSAAGTSTTATPTPAPQSPVESVSPSALTFSATQRQANPSGQAIKIANTGGTTLNWTASVDSSATSWLSTATGKGTVAAGQTWQVTVNVNITRLTPGSYSSNVTITATDSSGMQVRGSPQVIPVTLTVAQPCRLQVTSPDLSFTVVLLLQPNSSGKTITLTKTGNCALPISGTASADHSWIILSATSGTDSGSGSTITVHVNGSGMLVGQYQGQITISAVASGGASVQGSPQTVPVTMNVSL